ncbi:MAG: hypothetical protein BGO67_07055 [Alphaproteobacteria bacterium 41-28]|nr:MAG: hypothetical protein BGO67_07055 [Alphaproteobacteria bacterium 41-28]
MSYKSILKLNFILLLTLMGCNRYSIETGYDEFRNSPSCSLKDNLLKFQTGFFTGSYRLELNLDKVDNNTVLAHFCLQGYAKNSFFKPNSPILFKITHKDKTTEEIRLTPVSPAENKEWTQANYGYVTTYSKNSMSIVSANMTRDQILKIARAEKVGFALDAVGEPIRGELDQGDLQPIREFADKCLVQK